MLKNDPFDKFFDGMPTCETIHPLVEQLLERMNAMPDREELWESQLSETEKQLRDCLTQELAEIILPVLPPALRHQLEPYFTGLSQLVLTIGWLAHKEIAPKFEVQDADQTRK